MREAFNAAYTKQYEEMRMKEQEAIRYKNACVWLAGPVTQAELVIAGDNALQQAQVTGDERARFRAEAMAGDFEHALTTVRKWMRYEFSQ